MSPSQILRRARVLLEIKGWAQGAFAVNVLGREVETDDASAVRYCTSGALCAAAGHRLGGTNDFPESYQRARDYVLDAIHKTVGTRTSIVLFNDKIVDSVEPVLAVFDKAIEMADADEKVGVN